MKRKVLAFAMVLFAGIFSIQTVLAASDDYGTITDISKSDSATVGGVDIKGSEEETGTVIYSDVTLNITDPDNSVEDRPEGYAWLGIKVTKPTNATGEAKWTRTANVTLPKELERKDEKVEDDDSDYYFPINKTLLEAAREKGENLKYTYVFNWGNKTQTITIDISLKGVTLSDPEGNNLWKPEDATKKPATTTETTTTPAKQDDVPKTGSDLPIALFGAIALLLGVGAYNVKLAYSRK